MKKEVWFTALRVCALAVFSCVTAEAVTIINRTTGQLLFYDDFESAAAVSVNPYPDASGDFDPNHAVIGTWSVNEAGPTNIQVTAYRGNGTNDPAATPQGTNYLRVVRHTVAGAEVDVIMPTAQSTTGDVIHAETMVWVPRSVNGNAFQMQVLGSASITDFRANVITAAASGNAGNVNVWDATLATPNWVDTTLDWLVNTWQKWEIDYAVGGTNFILTIDGVKKTLPRGGVSGDVKTVAFRCGSAAANMQFRLDSTGYNGSTQESVTLFSDGFESGTAGNAPGLVDPDIGTYTGIGNGLKVRTGATSGGPAAAYSGTNYLELSRVPSLGLNINCMFAGGPIAPNAQELHASFRLWWGGAGFIGHGISTNSNFSSTSFLTYNASDAATRAYKAYNGTGYVNIAPAGTVPLNTWFPVELVWHPQTQTATVSINGGTPITNVLYGAVPGELRQLYLGSGASDTVYWADEVEAHWLYTPPPPPLPKGTLVLLN